MTPASTNIVYTASMRTSAPLCLAPYLLSRHVEKWIGSSSQHALIPTLQTKHSALVQKVHGMAGLQTWPAHLQRKIQWWTTLACMTEAQAVLVHLVVALTVLAAQQDNVISLFVGNAYIIVSLPMLWPKLRIVVAIFLSLTLRV
jgi:hypothetical protein